MYEKTKPTLETSFANKNKAPAVAAESGDDDDEDNDDDDDDDDYDNDDLDGFLHSGGAAEPGVAPQAVVGPRPRPLQVSCLPWGYRLSRG